MTDKLHNKLRLMWDQGSYCPAIEGAGREYVAADLYQAALERAERAEEVGQKFQTLLHDNLHRLLDAHNHHIVLQAARAYLKLMKGEG